MKHQVFSAYHPESQEALEYFHQTLKTMLHTYCLRTDREWDVGTFSCFCTQGNYSVMHVLKLKVLCGRIRVFVLCFFPVETWDAGTSVLRRKEDTHFLFRVTKLTIWFTRINTLKDVVSMFKGNVHWSRVILWPERWSTDTWQHAFRSRKNGQDG